MRPALLLPVFLGLVVAQDEPVTTDTNVVTGSVITFSSETTIFPTQGTETALIPETTETAAETTVTQETGTETVAETTVTQETGTETAAETTVTQVTGTETAAETTVTEATGTEVVVTETGTEVVGTETGTEVVGTETEAPTGTETETATGTETATVVTANAGNSLNMQDSAVGLLAMVLGMALM